MDALAMLGKTAGVLGLIVVLILGVAYLFNRLALQRGASGEAELRLVSSLALGQRERIVVIEVEDTWLVVGVANGHVKKLHQLAAREPDPTRQRGGASVPGGFAGRFDQAIRRLGSR